VIAGLIFFAGCATYSKTTGQGNISQADLDQSSEVALVYNLWKESQDSHPVDDRSYYSIVIRPRKPIEEDYRLKEIEGARRAGTFTLNQESLEVRTDDARRRIWFVERSAGCVIATLDRDTGETTWFPIEPPAWATLDGGVLLPHESTTQSSRTPNAEGNTAKRKDTERTTK
jgi:hypothetical protein